MHYMLYGAGTGDGRVGSTALGCLRHLLQPVHLQHLCLSV
eukprot:COSAG03_NODE_35127_length_120_cov_494.047619_1_plen_39_part_11